MISGPTTNGRISGRSLDVSHVAIVFGRGMVHFVAAALDRERSYEQLAGYVESQVDSQLYPEDAEAVRELLRRQQHGAAVELYFSRVGDRWDPEWLTVQTVQLADSIGPPYLRETGPRPPYSFLGVL